MRAAELVLSRIWPVRKGRPIALMLLAVQSASDVVGNLRPVTMDINVPIVLLTGEASPAHECLALDKRPIDVIGKSRGSEVLVRCLKGAVEAFGRTDQPRAGGCLAEAGQAVAQAQPMICGKLLLRLDVSRAYWKDVDLDLSLGEYNIVCLLVSNVGRYMTYGAIYDRLHYEGFIAGSGTDGYRGNMRSAIKRIRNKFGRFDPTFDEIENYNGFGYCWKKRD
jgi:two-component system response regulator ChvI